MDDSSDFSIRPIIAADREWIKQQTIEHWSAPIVVTRGQIFQPDELPGFIAERQGRLCGMLTYHIQDLDCEIVTLLSLVEGIGIGSALIEAVRKIASQNRCCKLWLITTNDNLPALRFYQKRGFHLVAVHRHALEATRAIKPGLRQLGMYDIPLRDEIELELLLNHDK
jgi:ribosomal protein S18 acetylase RimI-like enzyme